MFKSTIVLSSVLLFFIFSLGNCLTPLEEFVYRDDGIDPKTSYTLYNTIRGTGYTTYVLNFTSLHWFTVAETNHPTWWHWLIICIPDVVLNDDGFLFIDGGNYGTSMPTTTPVVVDTLCKSSRSVVSNLRQLPNEPVILDNDGKNRTEDDIISYTWYKYISNHTNTPPEYILQFPETKAPVRAMSCIQAFVKSQRPYVNVKTFTLSGASKRGWTSWLAAAVDSRVKAVIPLVMPILNIQENTNNHYRAYGGFSYAYYDYYFSGCIAYVNKPEFDMLANLIDPLSFANKLVKPKYIVQGVSDQYFIPDSASFFFSKLMGVKHLRIQPNADHSLSGAPGLYAEINTYYNMIINDVPLPEFDWSIRANPITNTTTMYVNSNKKSGAIFITQKPSKVLLWTADTISTTQRDWRLTKGMGDVSQNITFVSTEIQPDPITNIYEVTIQPPTAGGWRGAFIELTYSSIFGDQKYTTEFFYAPYTFPFASCGNNCGSAPIFV